MYKPGEVEALKNRAIIIFNNDFTERSLSLRGVTTGKNELDQYDGTLTPSDLKKLIGNSSTYRVVIPPGFDIASLYFEGKPCFECWTSTELVIDEKYCNILVVSSNNITMAKRVKYVRSKNV